ncbi:hypothetical protein [Streptomyces parvulus]
MTPPEFSDQVRHTGLIALLVTHWSPLLAHRDAHLSQWGVVDEDRTLFSESTGQVFYRHDRNSGCDTAGPANSRPSGSLTPQDDHVRISFRPGTHNRPVALPEFRAKKPAQISQHPH